MIIPATTEQEKRVLLAYLCHKIGAGLDELIGAMPYEIVSVTRNGRGVGVVLYTNFRGNSIEMTWAGEPGWITRGNLRVIFWYPFMQLGCLRVWGCLAKSNSAARKLCKDIGGREVGVADNEYGPGRDGIIFSMTREKCRWIGNLYGKKSSETARSVSSRGGSNKNQYRHGKKSGAVGDDKHDRPSRLGLIRH